MEELYSLCNSRLIANRMLQKCYILLRTTSVQISRTLSTTLIYRVAMKTKPYFIYFSHYMLALERNNTIVVESNELKSEQMPHPCSEQLARRS
jgi:hypothetical protein